MENGRVARDVGLEFKFGRMELSMKDNGTMVRQMAEGNLPMWMEMSTKVIGKMIRPVDMASISIITVQSTRENGWMIINTAKGCSHG